MQSFILKVERAKELIGQLKVELHTFLQTEPYKMEVKRDSENRPIYYISSATTLPNRIALISGEIIQQLRSALDNFAYSLFQKESPGQEGRHVYFPISDDKTRYALERDRKTAGMSDESTRWIDSLLPYKGGNDLLWQLHKLNNIDKHRLLIASGASFGSLNLGAVMAQFMRKSFPDQVRDLPELPALFIKPADNLFPLKLGDELFIDAPGAELLPNMQFRIDYVFNEPGVVEGYPIVGTLDSMVNEVERVVLEGRSKCL
jgi:hypothetical protein